MKSPLLLAAFLALSTPAYAQTDPHQWLEGVEDPTALAWVAKENTKTVSALQDARYQRLHDEAFEIASTDRRIPTYEIVGENLFSWWQNAEHVRGIWRRTSLKAYQRGAPQWQTVIDLDKLSKAEGVNWVWRGADCAVPAYDRCLIYLSNGGKDAVEVRELDLSGGRFVDGGFRFPEGKQAIEWVDRDTLITARAADGATESGYGYVVKMQKRGAAPVEVFRGEAGDVSVAPHVFHDAQGNSAVVIERGLDYFNASYGLLTDEGVTPLALPQRATLHGYLDGLLIFKTLEDWKSPGLGETFKAGSIIAYSPDMLTPAKDDELIVSNQVKLVFEPSARQSVEQVAVTAGRVVAVINDNVASKLIAFTNNGEWGWVQRELPGADKAAILIETASDVGDDLFYRIEGFLTPTQLKLANAASGKATTPVSMPNQFDVKGLVVGQHEATSKDGTRIPYFLVHRKDAPLDGQAPTLLHAYGGFQISKVPTYEAFVGKLWLEKGGAYVVANIRGGGEFGPAWHEAALKENRQRAYDDFYAVAEDLIARKVTSPRRLGIYGRSNGGLLMGVAMTQRPDLFNAVVIESPLLDMLRYHELPPGASWIGEYGDPRLPGDAEFIGRYSPYQALKAGAAYPVPYITTNTKDDRVHPGHARKFAARMGEIGAPYLYFENTEGGHANGADPYAQAVRWGMHYNYLMQRLMDR